jgi:3-deoxy-7-phosphoheptulonate synthase
MGMTKMGVAAIFETRGNDDCHIVLRGGRQPNYDDESVSAACGVLAAAGLAQRLMIDISHGNSGKQPERQIEIANDVARRIAAGERRIFGLMVESHLERGRQDWCRA